MDFRLQISAKSKKLHLSIVLKLMFFCPGKQDGNLGIVINIAVRKCCRYY